MAKNLNKRKESNLLVLKKDSNYFSSASVIDSQISLSTFYNKNKTKSKIVNNNKIVKINNYQNKKAENTIVSNYIKSTSPTTIFKTSNVDTSHSNDIIKNIKSKDNLSNNEQKDSKKKNVFTIKK